VVQVNGRTRGQVEVPIAADKDGVEAAALADPAVVRHIGGRRVHKAIYVPGRLINLVLKG
jgi:leucyl-tRNA synthetase